jgi:hypothetical protein
MQQQISKSHIFKSMAILGFVLVALLISHSSFAQAQKRVIQLSGVVLTEDGEGIPGVHIYVPIAGRGTTTNGLGFFSLPVLVGDSIVISSVAHTRQHYIVPQDAPEYQTIIVPMVEDVTYLKDVVIRPFPTEEVFKEAVLALNLPMDGGSYKSEDLSAELLALMVKTTPMDGPQNQRYYLDQWAANQNYKYQAVSNPFLNPFNWAKFFKSLKK